MDDLMATARVLMAQETRRVEMSAHNIANASTPGFKSEVPFQDLLFTAGVGGLDAGGSITAATDFTTGKLAHTGNPFDLAIEGDGFFAVNASEGMTYTRAGSFHRADDGRLVNAQGSPLQAAGGGDITLSGKGWRIAADGSVIDDGNPVATVGVFTVADTKQLRRTENGLFLADATTVSAQTDPRIRQGFIETSNVVVGDDMVRVMAAMRRVESGQKLVQAYDDMIGNVLQRLGDM